MEIKSGHGGWRPGAGRKPDPAGKKRRVFERRDYGPRKKVPAEPVTQDLSFSSVMALIEAIRASGRQRTPPASPFRVATHPPGATPTNKKLLMAMDDSLNWAGSQWSGEAAMLNSVAIEGLAWPGWAYLAQLAQRPEYRIISETIADDATRKWIDFDVTGNEDENRREQEKDPAGFAKRQADPDERKKRLARAGKTDKVKALKDDQDRLEVAARFYALARDDGFFGRSHLFVDLKGSDNPEELKTSIGDGRGRDSEVKVTKGSLLALKVIEATWCYPTTYNALNPLLPDWYDPAIWYVQGQELHRSRLLTFIGHPVPDILKPAYSFGGISMSQMVEPYVMIWLQTRESVAALIKAFSVMVLKTDLQTLLQPAGQSLLARAMLFNAMRDNQGLMMVNKATEDFSNVSASLAGLDHLQAQAQEHICSASRIPLVKFTGISPSGLNATSEFEIKVYDDTISAYQQRFMNPGLTRVVNFQQLSLFGEIDPEITHKFEPLRELSDKERSDQEKADAERDEKYVNLGVISPAEVRKRIVDDEDLPYTELDPEDLPDLKEEESEGLMPGGKAPPGEPDDDGSSSGKEPGAAR